MTKNNKGAYQRPFLKYAGNKHRHIEFITKHLPPDLGRPRSLVEPFAGSGALFMGTDYQSYLLADSNSDLINMYLHLQEHGESFIELVRSYFQPDNNLESRYYALREKFNELPMGWPDRSALFIYLNRHGYNGLCRYNSDGVFNTPFGKYDKAYFPEDEMRAFYKKSIERSTVFKVADFHRVFIDDVRGGDVVYSDPPYVPASPTANFTSYTGKPFGWLEHVELAKFSQRNAHMGIPSLISNLATQEVNRMYRSTGADLKFVSAGRSISSKAHNRSSVREVLAIYRAKGS